MATLLSQDRTRSTAGWLGRLEPAGNEIPRTFVLPSFPAALMFASAVGQLAERADHHPDILISYRKVTLTLSTHSAGGLTEKDFSLAAQINAIA